jgi:hypothetical protein
MPPVPPHPMTNATGQEDEALASMLMSWYLSGYYTGHYQVQCFYTTGSFVFIIDVL